MYKLNVIEVSKKFPSKNFVKILEISAWINVKFWKDDLLFNFKKSLEGKVTQNTVMILRSISFIRNSFTAAARAGGAEKPFNGSLLRVAPLERKNARALTKWNRR